jgi:hypothetical protein
MVLAMLDLAFLRRVYWALSSFQAACAFVWQRQLGQAPGVAGNFSFSVNVTVLNTDSTPLHRLST